ncbi:hypothetical protein BT93_J1450 [Corymbia citriodora subsp. variegata]|nr:hypothetical protein BT93_J1450 [Corymbia citriodora subsp. variegata]
MTFKFEYVMGKRNGIERQTRGRKSLERTRRPPLVPYKYPAPPFPSDKDPARKQITKKLQNRAEIYTSVLQTQASTRRLIQRRCRSFRADSDFPFPSSSLSASTFRENSAFVNTRIDWRETPEAHVFKADLPGLKKEEVKVEIEDDRVLQISGERNVEKEDKNDTWHRVERSSGKFMRRFRLPENAKMDQVKASMENGVLTVTVPKVEEKKREVKAVEISG